MATSLAECKEYRSERRIVRPDGSIRYIVSRGEPIFNEEQELQTYVGAYLDITEQKEAEIALCQSREKLRELAAHLERVREEERKRIAREVHDELGSLLTGIKAHLSVAIDHGVHGAKPIDKLLVEAVKLTDVATETVRRVITDLRPSVLDHLGVWAALEWYVDQVQQRTELHCACTISESTAATQLNSEQSTMVFRIVQEALTNVVRHAEATNVTIRAMRQDESIKVEIEDNGKGIDAERLLASTSWGIVGMHERARYFGGELKVMGTP